MAVSTHDFMNTKPLVSCEGKTSYKKTHLDHYQGTDEQALSGEKMVEIVGKGN